MHDADRGCADEHSGLQRACNRGVLPVVGHMAQQCRMRFARVSPGRLLQRCAAGHVFEMHGGRDTPRRERALSVAPPLRLRSVPPAWLAAPVVYVAPILGECGPALVRALRSRVVVVGAQGWLRRRDSDDWVTFAESAAFARPPHNVTALIMSEADHPDALGAAAALGDRGHLVVLTQGRRGGIIFAPGQAPQRYAASIAAEVDPTGAGDCFGMIFALGLACNKALPEAASLAAAAAARVVEGPELGRLGAADVVLHLAG
ncbi:MAG: hypothetical protein EOO40_05845 [Deltaproteobacteria bacterium]|nr:MAG: hypothetical protein EOO40_05845 [Deltaproteobacteria bacterium]